MKCYVLDNDWLIQANSRNYHHFFPKAYLRKQGWAPWEINHVSNITIIDAHLNKVTIRDKPPATYMRKFDNGHGDLRKTMSTHLINLERGVWDNNYENFVEARCQRIARELNKLVLPQPSESKGRHSVE